MVLDIQHGIRKDGDIFKIGDSPVLVYQDGDITIKEEEFRVSEGMWELLTRKRVNKEHVTSEDLQKYKIILLRTNAHLEGYQPGGVVNVSRGKNIPRNYRPGFRETKSPRCRIRVTACMEKTKMSARALYYNRRKPSGFSTMNKLSAALPKKNKSKVRASLEHQDVYTMHRPVTKRFLRNPYTVSKIMNF